MKFPTRFQFPAILWAGWLAFASSAGAEPVAHWRFEPEAPFEDSISKLHLDSESTDPGGKRVFRVTNVRPPRAIDGKASLLSPNAPKVDLRLRVNAPTRGENPFRLSGNPWTISGWFQHSGATPGKSGHVIAGTHGFLKAEELGFGGWSLRVLEPKEGVKVLSALFSSGGKDPIEFEAIGTQMIEAGDDKWYHFALTWIPDGGRSGKGEARLFLDGRSVGTVTAPARFDPAEADRNAYRGLWIAGRLTSEKGDGSENWAGRLDEIKFSTGTVADERLLAAEFAPETPKGEPKEPEAAPEPDKQTARVVKAAPTPTTEPIVMPEIPPDPEPPATPTPPTPSAAAKSEPSKDNILEPRTWNDLRGRTLEASLVVDPAQRVSGRVMLLTTDKIRVSMLTERLSEADREYVQANGG